MRLRSDNDSQFFYHLLAGLKLVQYLCYEKYKKSQLYGLVEESQQRSEY